MSAQLKTLDPEDFLCHVGGVLIDGYDSDSQVKVSRDEDAWNEKAGMTREVARMRVHNAMGMIEFTLLQTSASNDYLMALHRKDLATGKGTVSCQAEDVNGTTTVKAINCYVKKMADIERGSEVKSTTWRLRIPNIEGPETNVGGNEMNIDVG